MQIRNTAVPGYGTSHHISRIWYETSLVLHLGDAYSSRPTDFLAFSVIVYLVVRSNLYRVPIPSLLKTIARDATYYFLFIFTSHLVLVMFMAFASVRISSVLYLLSTTRLDLYSLHSRISLPCKWRQDAFSSFANRFFPRAIVETSCASEHPFALEATGSDPV